jgi:hypothetical protein
MIAYLAYVRDPRISIGGKVVHVYPEGVGPKTTAVAVDTGRSIEFCPDQFCPETFFVAETYDGLYAELEKRGWNKQHGLSVKTVSTPKDASHESDEPEEPAEAEELEPATEDSIEPDVFPTPEVAEEVMEPVAEVPAEPVIEVLEQNEVEQVRTIEIPAAPVEKAQKACPECGAPAKGRGYDHVPGCKKSTAERHKPNFTGERPKQCPLCGGLPKATGYDHKRLPDGNLCPNSSAVKYPHTLKRKKAKS